MSWYSGNRALYDGLPVPWTLPNIQPELRFYTRKKYNGDLTENELLQTLSILPTDPQEPGFLPLETALSPLLAKLKKTNRLIFITHGFTSSISSPWLHQMKDELHKVEEHDQIVAILGWGDGAKEGGSLRTKHFYYVQAVVNALLVGEWLGGLVQFIHKKMLERTGKKVFIWGIGHSLGAHLMGMAGHTAGTHEEGSSTGLWDWFAWMFGYGKGSNAFGAIHLFDRITGLDPAGPGFQTCLPGYRRICREDATMVDIIHTDGNAANILRPVPLLFNGIKNYLGTLVPLGGIDFYPNFGYGTRKGSKQNHSLAYELFTWSIGNRGALMADQGLAWDPHISNYTRKPGVEVYPCRDLRKEEISVEMGYYTAPGSTGCKYIKIPDSLPFVKTELIVAKM